jgi:hypothetical protein
VSNDNMSDRLRSMSTRLAAFVGVIVAAGLLFLAAMSVYQMMWPLVPFGQMVIEISGSNCNAAQRAPCLNPSERDRGVRRRRVRNI